MKLKGVRVKVLDSNGSFISFRYISSNARSRMKKDQFMQDFKDGTYHVVNPGILEKG